MNEIEELELKAKEARRMADIAKHKPLSLETLDSYGDKEMREAIEQQIPLMNISSQLQNAYCKEFEKLRSCIVMLRNDALYWRQKYQQSQEPPCK